MSDWYKVLCRRALSNADPALLQVTFDQAVLDKYRQAAGFSVIRTNTAGRVSKEGGWSLDFGIGEGDRMIHASWTALTTGLPEAEREHWAAHADAPAMSDNFLRMQLAPVSCFDDGELRAW